MNSPTRGEALTIRDCERERLDWQWLKNQRGNWWATDRGIDTLLQVIS